MTANSAVIFDVDGTLTKPYLDFDAIRAEIGVTGPILEAMVQLAAPERARAESILLRHEWNAARNATLHDGAAEVVAACRGRGYRVGILTRNARPTTVQVLAMFGIEVDAIRTREDGAIKPAPDGVLSLCSELGAAPARSWMVGDFLFDILAGERAGTRTVLMSGDGPRPSFADRAGFVIRRLPDLLPILDRADRPVVHASQVG